MRFSSLGSGSRGNATLVEFEDTCLLVDCGFGIREATRRLGLLGKTPESLTAILVTHEHSDHVGGVLSIAKKYSTPVYASHGTAIAAKLDALATINVFDPHTPFNIGCMRIVPVPVPHDAREPTQFILETEKHRLGVLTDLGMITPFVERNYSSLDALLLESNHDPLMLASGPYPASLKRRVGGSHGHLSNQQALDLLNAIDLSRLQHLVVAHVSEKNNSVAHVEAKVLETDIDRERVHIATQQEGFDWRYLQ